MHTNIVLRILVAFIYNVSKVERSTSSDAVVFADEPLPEQSSQTEYYVLHLYMFFTDLSVAIS